MAGNHKETRKGLHKGTHKGTRKDTRIIGPKIRKHVRRLFVFLCC